MICFLIGLCNIFYKIISKVLFERLTQILPHGINESHEAFLKHRGAAQTTLAGLEFIHQIIHSSKTLAYIQNIVIKFDLSKAFDRVE